MEAPIPQATITNSTGKAIGAVQYQRCGSTQWSALPISALAPGRSVTLQLPEDCVDLDAFYADGKVAGSQRGIKRDFPFTWVLY